MVVLVPPVCQQQVQPYHVHPFVEIITTRFSIFELLRAPSPQCARSTLRPISSTWEGMCCADAGRKHDVHLRLYLNRRPKCCSRCGKNIRANVGGSHQLVVAAGVLLLKLQQRHLHVPKLSLTRVSTRATVIWRVQGELNSPPQTALLKSVLDMQAVLGVTLSRAGHAK